jgi:DNA-directed RNA polymerase subunit delta
MAKSEKPKKASVKKVNDAEEPVKKASSRPAKNEDDDDDDELDGEETPKKGRKPSSKKSGEDEEEEEEDETDEVDDWNKVEEEEEWDPDFNEFDIPKSKGKKSTGGAKKGASDEDDFGIDEEFKDMGFADDFNDGFDDDDDF